MVIAQHAAVLTIPSQSELWGALTPGVEQAQAIEKAANFPVLAMTGGPGVGKTATTSALVKLFKANNLSCVLLAPTGKAARRMSEQTGELASTIHRAIIPVNGRAQKELSCDVVIVDECSMVDVELMAALLDAVKPGMRIVLVGDVDQLPSIGPGRVLADLLSTGKIPTARLTRIYRQASESRIPYVARDINEGRSPDLALQGTDVSFIEVVADDDSDAARERQLIAIQQMIVHAVTKVIPGKKGITANQIQVLCAQKNRAIGVEAMNGVLQQAINPSNGRSEIFIGAGYVCRSADRVIQKRNNYDFGPGVGEGVMNGEIGIVEECNPAGFAPDLGTLTSFRNPKSKKVRKDQKVLLVVNYGDKKVGYTRDECRDLHLAYACTVHSFQGSQAPAIVFPVHPTHSWMLTRKLVYTAVTRAEKFCLFVGVANSVYKAARNPKGDERRTSLAERLMANGRDDVVTPNPEKEIEKEITYSEYVEAIKAPPTTDAVEKSILETYFATEGASNETESTAAPSVASATILPGYYQVRFTDGRGVVSFRIVEGKNTMVDKLIAEFKIGHDDWKGCAFVSGSRINIWKKLRDDTRLVDSLKILEQTPEACAKEFTQNTGKCYVCSRKLEAPESVKRGIGPECAKRGY